MIKKQKSLVILGLVGKPFINICKNMSVSHFNFLFFRCALILLITHTIRAVNFFLLRDIVGIDSVPQLRRYRMNCWLQESPCSWPIGEKHPVSTSYWRLIRAEICSVCKPLHIHMPESSSNACKNIKVELKQDVYAYIYTSCHVRSDNTYLSDCSRSSSRFCMACSDSCN